MKSQAGDDMKSPAGDDNSNLSPRGLTTGSDSAENDECVMPDSDRAFRIPRSSRGMTEASENDNNDVPCRFYHISTDEVYGALKMNRPEGVEPPFKTVASSEGRKAYGDDFFYETTPYNPHSPYSAANT